MQYDNTNRGALYKNDRKENEKHPDYSGSINVDGKDFWLSAWIKEGKGGKFFSMSVRPKEDKGRSQAKPTPKSRGVEPDFDEDLPF